MVEDVRVISKTENVSLENLHVRYIPMARLERWYVGIEPMLLKNSPHVEMLTLYRYEGLNWDKLMKGRYAEERRARRKDFGQKKWSEDFIKEHIKHRIKVYKSMAKAWSPSKDDKPIMILKEPFWNTRFGQSFDGIVGPEIWNGAGRCAAAWVLNQRTIPAVWVEDCRPGAKECERITRKFKNANI